MVDWVWKVSEDGKSVDVDVAECRAENRPGRSTISTRS